MCGFWGMRCLQVVPIAPSGIDPSCSPKSALRQKLRPSPTLLVPAAQDRLEASLKLGDEIVAILKEILDKWSQRLRIFRTQ